MKIYDLPFVYEQSARRDMEQAVSTRESQCNQRIQQLNSAKKKDQAGIGIGLAWPVGLIGGFIACANVSCSQPSSWDGIGVLILWVVIACSLGGLIDLAVHTAWKKEIENTDELIAQTEREKEENVKEIRRNFNEDCKRYTSAFEKTVQDMSVQYAASSLAQSVISWMTEGFCRTIDAADRRSHIEMVNVPFLFNVYTNEITCNLGKFNFELQRCRNLNSPLEQTALARAIASSIQLNIVKKYPQDTTGSPVDVSISFSYTAECPIVTVTYIAQNFNYKPVRDW